MHYWDFSSERIALGSRVNFGKFLLLFPRQTLPFFFIFRLEKERREIEHSERQNIVSGFSSFCPSLFRLSADSTGRKDKGAAKISWELRGGGGPLKKFSFVLGGALGGESMVVLLLNIRSLS